MLKKAWDGIKLIVTLKAKTESSPNALTLNRITIKDKKVDCKTFHDILSILVPILHRKSEKENEIEKLIKNLSLNKKIQKFKNKQTNKQTRRCTEK